MKWISQRDLEEALGNDIVEMGVEVKVEIVVWFGSSVQFLTREEFAQRIFSDAERRRIARKRPKRTRPMKEEKPPRIYLVPGLEPRTGTDE